MLESRLSEARNRQSNRAQRETKNWIWTESISFKKAPKTTKIIMLLARYSRKAPPCIPMPI